MLTILALLLTGAGSASGQAVLSGDVAPPYSVPMAEGLFRIHAAEPLGKGGFNIRMLQEAYRLEVGKVGKGNSFTGHIGIGYGVGNGLDLSASVPLLMDEAGGLTKYGTGDIVTSLKYGSPAVFPSKFHWGLNLTATHPYGYKGQEALNVRSYTRTSREVSARALFDLNVEAVGFRANLGYLASSSLRQPGPMYGVGVEVGRGQIFTMSAEYWDEPSAAGGKTQRAVFGGHMNLWSIRVQAGLEKGISRDLPNWSAMAGVQLHRSVGGKSKKYFGGRIRRIAKVKDIGTTIRVAVVNFSGFEDHKAGEMLASQIKTSLSRYGHIRVVEVGEGTEYMDPDAAVRLAQVSNADYVITGRVLRHELNREARPNLPLVVGFPLTEAMLEADIRVVDQQKEGEVLATRVTGKGRQTRGVRLFPTSGDDRTSYLSAVDRERIWGEAGMQIVTGLLSEMGGAFAWLPE